MEVLWCLSPFLTLIIISSMKMYPVEADNYYPEKMLTTIAVILCALKMECYMIFLLLGVFKAKHLVPLLYMLFRYLFNCMDSNSVLEIIFLSWDCVDNIWNEIIKIIKIVLANIQIWHYLFLYWVVVTVFKYQITKKILPFQKLYWLVNIYNELFRFLLWNLHILHLISNEIPNLITKPSIQLLIYILPYTELIK